LVELGESVEEAVIREVREETGMTVRLERLLGVYTEVRRDTGGRVKYHYVIVDYAAEAVDSRVTLNDESSAYEWLSPSEAKEMALSENIKACIREFERGHGRQPHGGRSKAPAEVTSSAGD
jgi:ADP-ribose pyrophosphatase YjhB (NUDIX family)